jgi:hypothetical protein
MRRILGPAGVALVLVVAPTPATAACRLGDGPRFDARIVAKSARNRPDSTVLVLCDRRNGRTRVLARATYSYGPEQGTLLADAQAAGSRVAWIAGTGRDGRRTATVTVADARTGRRLSRRTVASWRGGLRPWALSIALTTRGELGWIAPAPSDSRGAQVVVARPGLATRVVAESRDLGFLAIEDDRTLRWRHADLLAYHDIRPAGPGCPRRARFEVVDRLDGLVVTRAVYGGADSTWDAARVCDLLTGRDPVVGAGSYVVGFGSQTLVVGGRAPWVVLQLDELSRYDGCVAGAVAVVNVRAGGGPSRYADVGRCDSERRTSVTVTDAGAAAWLGDLGTEQRIAAIAAGGGIVELDRAPAGSLGALQVDGETFTWTRDGQPRSAPAP